MVLAEALREVGVVSELLAAIVMGWSQRSGCTVVERTDMSSSGEEQEILEEILNTLVAGRERLLGELSDISSRL